MAIGASIAEARKRQEKTQLDVSHGINYSREALSKFETGDREIPKEIIPKIAQNIDDPRLYFDTWKDSSGFVSVPYFDGDYIDQHPTSMMYLVQKETAEALEAIESAVWSKPASMFSQEEKDHMKQVLKENLDAAASMINLVASMCKAHDFSMRDLFREWNVSLKIRKFNK
ncbi:helix-turn-helix transcriptional regulator [Neobacillus sp. MM2021_6]|uniref:helix-turn-helix domain-containing protein n=1 Tax=Bacillaceae TaxID=186817 RepID=UPI00140DCF87|nr:MULTISPECIES: helix-turn-helix transcriptional regulator [Bacillaceae]MBO0962528.1 helix-turn-helix transcriptional regulator [Neobacillus sp. MM2021_6]NHC20994.1 helix-turn-helix transcriptional regulator [Bacillus sp. MM2020_4]